ncbi:NADH-quinone oxidoreductase subunit A [Parabacteroides sp. Marseille-P3160]|uniref:NADH-quinone oxidoreductase subunit A n=1 Tax=Parabacteroides sp. Marseille-P3160 TaxID=1917887 RepID=UPI0009BBA63A|nr:NADH-quinone oxidoreductase subunit A [Parabacteroides sp. Marseille-P3160]
MNSSLFLVVLITGMFLVCAGLGLALLLSPRSFNAQKGEAYECGVPTKGTSWMQFRVGYYLYSILYLMFDVEAVFLFPWATVVRELGVPGLISVIFFLFILGLGLAYAWRKGVLKWE